ncbi:MAG TPA: hypothetical protein VMW35_03540 [Myxococcota bacterium]|nr:hypothetical protein [Myxococcota bacterium]
MLPLALVLLLVAVAYGGALKAGYISDDRDRIVESPLVTQLAPLATYFAPFGPGAPSGPAGAYFRPVTALSHALERHYLGSDPFGPHLVNLAIHLVCVALAFCLARRAGASPWASALAAGLFGVFPRSTEAVTWISARATLLSTASVLLALLLYRPEEGRAGSRIAAALVLAVGFLCKEFAAVGAGAIVVLELVEQRRRGGSVARMVSRLAPVVAVALVYVALRPPLVELSYHFGLLPRAIASVQALGYDAWMLATPFRAKMFIGMLGIVQPAFLAAGTVVAFACLAGAWVVFRRPPSPLETAAYAIAAGGIVVALPILPVGDIANTADRFLYPVVGGLAVGLAARSQALAPRWATRAAVLALGLVLLFALATHRRNELWQDELALATDTLERTSPQLEPYAFPIHFWLSSIHRCSSRWEEAIAEQQRGITALARFAYVFPHYPGIDVQIQVLELLKEGRVRPSEVCQYR